MSRSERGSGYSRVTLIHYSENKEVNLVFVCSTVLMLSWWTFKEITVSLPNLGIVPWTTDVIRLHLWAKSVEKGYRFNVD